jgi:hypothetical protein
MEALKASVAASKQADKKKAAPRKRAAASK